MKAMDEKHLREKYGIEDDDWERTPISVRQIVVATHNTKRLGPQSSQFWGQIICNYRVA